MSRAGVRSTRAMGRFDRGVALLLVGLAAFFTLRTPAWGKFDPLPTGPRAGLGYLATAAFAIAVLAMAVRRESRLVRVLGRVTISAFAVLAMSMAVSRFLLWRETEAQADPWPPRFDRLAIVELDSLPAPRRAMWGARLGAHLALDRGKPVLPIIVATNVPFPSDVEVGTRWQSPDELEVWARASDGAAACVPVLLALDMRADSLARRARCTNQDTAPAGVQFAPPLRRAPPTPPSPPARSHPAWVEYRADAERSDLVPGTADLSEPAPLGWSVAIDGPVRASASASDDLVLIGAHGTGSLTALDAATGAVRWIARVPNWIHQDPVTDGAILAVGFGDNLDSFAGRSPSGVAAFALVTGQRLWTAFDQGSVMTSPVIVGGALIYGTGAGLVLRRDLATGALLAADTLPGTVTMAPPAVIGDTVVFSLDYGLTCAILATTLAERWCTDLADLRMMGHAAPSIINDEVLVSGVATALTPTPGELDDLEPDLLRRLLVSVLFPGKYDVYAGQVFAAIDLHDGRLRWRSPLYANPHLVAGHVSGTAIADDSIGVVILPVADTVVAFDPESGARRWSSPAHGARGPALLLAGQAIVAGRDGVIMSWGLRDGAARCRINRPIGFDRAGPTPVAGRLVFVRLDGVIESMPAAALLACREVPLRLAGRIDTLRPVRMLPETKEPS